MKGIYIILFIIKIKCIWKKRKKVRFSDDTEIHIFQRDTFIIRYESVLLFQLKKIFTMEDIIIKIIIPNEYTPVFSTLANGTIEPRSIFSHQDHSYELSYLTIRIEDEYLYLIIEVNGMEHMIKIDYQEILEEYYDSIEIHDVSGYDIIVSIF